MSLIFLSFLFTFNVNLLYLLYHDFLGQIFFWGIEVFLLIFLFSYLSDQEIKNKDFLKYDFIIGLTLSVLFFSYHEATVFFIVPLLLFFISRLIVKTNISYYTLAFIRIFFITGLTSFFSIINAIKVDYEQAFTGDPNAQIGWQLFRSKIPYANPFEALSFYSIHSFEPLPTILAAILSLLVIIVIVYGIIKSKEKLLLINFLIVYLVFYYWTGIYQHNFWSYNRALTYTLPLIIVLFVIGFTNIFFKKNNKNKIVGILTQILLVILILSSAKNLSNRFFAEHFAVGKDYVSLKNIQNDKKLINEPLYIENNIDPSIPYWNYLWIRYFLNINKFPIYSEGKGNGKIVVPENALILIHKPNTHKIAPRIILKDIIWENEFFVIGRLCKSDKCLMNAKEDMSQIIFGKTSFEDSLLISGWSASEPESRWAVGKQSSLKLINNSGEKTKIIIEALTLKEPQTVVVSINGVSIGSFSPSTEFKTYNVALSSPLSQGLHTLTFTYSNSYKPSEIFQSADSRELSVNFKQIRLE